MARRNFGVGVVAIVVALFLLKAYAPWQTSKEEGGQTATSRASVISANSQGGVSNIPATAIAPVTSASSPSGAVTVAASAVAANSAPLGNTPALLSSGVAAADDSQSDDERCLSDPYGCPCKEKLSELPITAPQGMSLTHANGCSRHGDDFLGEFIFKGDATISGVIERNAGDMWDTIRFKAEHPSKHSEFASAIYSLKFEDSEEVIGKFKLPILSEKSMCWAADVVIKVRELEVKSGFSDEAGNYPKDFEVLKIGKYRTCKRH